MAIFDFLDRGGSMGDPFGGEGSLSGIRSEYNPETKEYKFFDEDDQQITDPDRVKELTEKFTAEDDIDAGGTTSGIDSLDISKFTDILGDAVGAGKPTSRGPIATQSPPRGQLPLSMQGSVSYRPTQSPYQVPSYLMSSAQYNEQISKMLGGLLARSIRSNPIKLLV
jgi:hypothetical protein